MAQSPWLDQLIADYLAARTRQNIAAESGKS